MRHTSDGGGSGGQGEDAEDVGEHFEDGWELLSGLRGWYCMLCEVVWERVSCIN